MNRVELPNISPRAWEHPADRAALNALKQVPGLDEVVKFFLGMTGEKSIRLLHLASSVRVGPKQFSRLDSLMAEACRVLDVQERPELYVTQNPVLNAGAIGVKQPFITLNSSLIDTLDDEETLAVIAHELGHIMSGHMLYKTLLWVLLNAAAFFVRIPVAQIVLAGVVTALKEWYRKSELSCDRAGLLVVQEPKVATTLLMKLAGGKNLDEMDIDEFKAQADEYDAGGDVMDGVYKLLNLMGQTHPFAVLRLQAIDRWAQDGEYNKILEGEYPIRSDGEYDFAQDFSDASKAYQEELKQSKDPLAKAMADIGDSLEGVRQEAERFFGTIFQKRQ
jgi:Zn-dependent protease with chaperone function